MWKSNILLFILSLTYCNGLLSVGEEPQEVSFFVRKDSDSKEHIARKGMLVRHEGAPATILLLHGYGVDKYDISPFRLLLRDYNSFTFDFRAHGENVWDQESTLGHDEVHDVFGAVDYIRSQPDLKDKPLIVLGFSMGAATAIEAQSLDPDLFDAMFLDTPFSASSDVLRHSMDKMKMNFWGYEFNLPGRDWLESYAYSPNVQPVIKFLLKLKTSFDPSRISTTVKQTAPVESIKNVRVPIFFVVTKDDEKVRSSDVRHVYDNHPGCKKLWIANGRRHCDAVFYNPERYEKKLNEFIEGVLSGEFSNNLKAEELYDS